MFCVCDGVADDLDSESGRVTSIGETTTHVLEEDLQDTPGLLVDEAGDTLHTTSAGETADGGLGDTLDAERRVSKRDPEGRATRTYLSRKILRWRLAPPL